jgi:hypothetical protein
MHCHNRGLLVSRGHRTERRLGVLQGPRPHLVAVDDHLAIADLYGLYIAECSEVFTIMGGIRILPCALDQSIVRRMTHSKRILTMIRLTFAQKVNWRHHRSRQTLGHRRSRQTRKLALEQMLSTVYRLTLRQIPGSICEAYTLTIAAFVDCDA